ncbi:MAG TPA: AAA family ATPase, partial [Actinoplanes sp.]
WDADAGIPRTAFRLDAGAAAEPSVFVVDLVIDGVQYVYGFALGDHRVEEEWLYSYPRRHKRVIFERRRQTVEWGSTVVDRRSRGELLASLTRENSLLLSAAVQAKQNEVLPVHRWFRQGLRIDGDRRPWRRSTPSLADRVATAVKHYPEFVDLLKVADLGISGIRVVETIEEPSALSRDRAARLAAEIAETEGVLTDADADAEAIELRLADLRRELAFLRMPKRRRELLFLHGADEVALGPEEQSDGTLTWVDLLMSALLALSTGALLVTDEIDASLHPRLSARLIELFRSPETNPSGAQLLFTTHDATLLGTNLGQEVLKRDEIWFVEKDDGASRLYPLSDFRPRNGENRERRYLGGSYGGVPAVFVNSLVDSVLEAKSEQSDASA